MKWIYNGVEFRVGDYVKVVRFAESGQKDGMGEGIDWDNTWVNCEFYDGGMDAAITRGYTFEIIEIDECGVYFADFADLDEQPMCVKFSYPLSVLQHV